jgi:hypothetical protein
MFFKINGQRTNTTYKEKDAYYSYIKRPVTYFSAGGNKTVYVETETCGSYRNDFRKIMCRQSI